MMEKRTHLQPGKCPGHDYFQRKAEEDDERIRNILADVLGDVPKYMRMAGDNRIWLWALSAVVVVGVILIII